MKKRGKGIACMYYGIGKTGHPGPASAFAEILDDGNLIVWTGLADMGQGADTGLAQIAADTLGVPFDYVTIYTGDTGSTPDAGVTSASRSIYVVGNAVHEVVRCAMEPILIEAASLFECKLEEIVAFDFNLFLRDNPEQKISLIDIIAKCRSKGIQTLAAVSYNPKFKKLDSNTGQGEPYPTYAFGTQIAEVEVDTVTGEVTVLRIIAAHDVGNAINPTSVEGQIQGGVAQGIGQALMEEIKIDNGRIITDSFQTYLLPTALDICDVETIIVQDYEPSGPFGAKGVGEPALIPTMSAIVGAIYDATGVLITELPATAEKVLEGLKKLNPLNY